MPFHSIRRVALIAILTLSLATPAPAETIQAAGDQLIAGIVVVSAAVAVLVTYLIIHHKNANTTIIGCVKPEPAGLSLIDEKDNRSYVITGAAPGIKPGYRMTLQGKRRSKASQQLSFEARSVLMDYGTCSH